MQNKTDVIEVEGRIVKLSNLDKVLWPELGITKLQFIKHMAEISDLLIKHAKNRLLTTIRYPDGIYEKSFFQKDTPDYAPNWVNTCTFKDNDYILLNSKAVLVWLCNLAAFEFHTTFNTCSNVNNPTHLVFDLDPTDIDNFDMTTDAALNVYNELKALGFDSFVKTSGSTGLQIYIPVNSRYNYDNARAINKFFAEYFTHKYPNLFTIERQKSKRENKIYFDYLQMWKGKTIVSVYSPRANKFAGVSTPITWDELQKGIKPADFNLLNIKERVNRAGDLLDRKIDYNANIEQLDVILDNLKK